MALTTETEQAVCTHKQKQSKDIRTTVKNSRQTVAKQSKRSEEHSPYLNTTRISLGKDPRNPPLQLDSPGCADEGPLLCVCVCVCVCAVGRWGSGERFCTCEKK